MHKKQIPILLAIVVSFFNCKQSNGLSVYNPYNERVQLFKESKLIASNVFIGDSITERAAWQDLLSNSDIANRGINGDTSIGILNRIDDIFRVKPKKAFLMFGINDYVWNSPDAVDDVFNHYKQIIARLRKANVAVFVSSTIKCNINMAGKGCALANQKIEVLNSHLKSISQGGITFIDVNKKLSDNNGLIENYTQDGVHLNLDGYKEWAKLLHPFLDDDITAFDNDIAAVSSLRSR